MKSLLQVVFLTGALLATLASGETARRVAPRPHVDPVAPPPSPQASRLDNRFGIMLGLLKPLGSGAGLNIGYNFFSFTRVSTGFGWFPVSASSPTGTASGSANFFSFCGDVKVFVPGWNVSPFIGGGVTHVATSGSVTANSVTFGFGQSTTKLYFDFGFDWQTHGGFQLALGAHVFEGLKVVQTSSTTAAVVNDGTFILPYLTVGLYFDWLNF